MKTRWNDKEWLTFWTSCSFTFAPSLFRMCMKDRQMVFVTIFWTRWWSSFYFNFLLIDIPVMVMVVMVAALLSWRRRRRWSAVDNVGGAHARVQARHSRACVCNVLTFLIVCCVPDCLRKRVLIINLLIIKIDFHFDAFINLWMLPLFIPGQSPKSISKYTKQPTTTYSTFNQYVQHF